MPARPGSDATQDQPEPTPIAALGEDLEPDPGGTPVSTVADRLARPRAGLTTGAAQDAEGTRGGGEVPGAAAPAPCGEKTRRARSETRRAAQSDRASRESPSPPRGGELHRPPGSKPEPARPRISAAAALEADDQVPGAAGRTLPLHSRTGPPGHRAAQSRPVNAAQNHQGRPPRGVAPPSRSACPRTSGAHGPPERDGRAGFPGRGGPG